MKRALLALALVAAGLAAQADVPRVLGYQGRILKADGTAATGQLTVVFTIYDAAEGGNKQWSETQSLALSDGFYSTTLGAKSQLSGELFDGTDRYLEIAIDATPLTPRQRLTTSPYALRAFNAENLKGGSVDASAIAVNGVGVIDANGRLAGPARYAAGAGIAIDPASRAISLLTTCSSNQILKWDGSTWNCADDSGNAYTGSNGVQISGNAIGLTSQCASGQILKWNGTSWACAGDDNTAVVAGPGLVKTGNSLGLPSTCNAGELLKFDGATWSCAPDTDSTYKAGNGLALTGNTLSLTKSCQSQEILAWDGTKWVCAPDGDTKYTAGAGITLTGTTFSLSKACSPGQLLKWTGSDWQCAADDNTGVVAGSGLSKSGSTLGLLSTCNAGEILKFDGSSWACAADASQTYKAGNGLALTGNTFSLTKACDVGQFLAWDGAAWGCTDQTVQTYQAGNGLALAGNTFALTRACGAGQILKWNGTAWGCAGDDNTSYVPGTGMGLAISGNTIGLISSCTANQVLKWSGTAWTCAADQTGASSFAAGPGLELAGSTFQVKTTCASGQILKWSGSDWVCAADAQSTLTAAAGIKIDAANNVSVDFASGTHAGTATTAARSDHEHDDRYYTKAEVDGATTPTGFRKYTAVIGVRNASACPAGWTVDSMTTLADQSSYVYVNIQESGVQIGGRDNGYAGDYLYTRIPLSGGMTAICSKTFNTRGKAHTSWLAMNVPAPNPNLCPSGYTYLKHADLARNDNYVDYHFDHAGFYAGGLDSWDHSSQPYRYGWHYKYDSGQATMYCFKVMGVEEDPATRFGVFPVIMGVKAQAACPATWNYVPYTQLMRSDGYQFTFINDNVTTLGSDESRGYGGANYNWSYQNGNSYSIAGMCFKYFASTGGVPSTNIHPLTFSTCAATDMNINVTDVNGPGTGYLQRTQAGLWIGPLYDWDRSDTIAGSFQQSFTTAQINRYCFKMENAQ